MVMVMKTMPRNMKMLMVTHLAEVGEVGEVGDDDAHAKEDDDDDGDAKLKMLMATHLAEVGRGVFGLRASSRTTCEYIKHSNIC